MCRAAGQDDRGKGIVINERQGFVQFQGSLLPPPPGTGGTGSRWHPLQHPGCTGWGVACATKAVPAQKPDPLEAPQPKTSF